MIMDLPSLHIYVHWPWCKQKCPYCDFNSHALPANGLPVALRERYIRQVIEEIKWWCTQVAPNRPIGSLFFGGGTPSLMHPHEIAEVIAAAQTLGAWQDSTEVTLECNPTSLEEDCGHAYFQQLRAIGVNRLSIGVQGLRDDWLQFLGRTHSANGALATLAAAQQVFARVNADVIYGLPNQTLQDWEQLLQTLAGMGLSHIAAYQLTIERNTAFWGQVRRNEWQPVENDLEADFFALTQATLCKAGYENYEISNFAKPGQACQHNQGVWRSEDYLGVGAGAHGRVTLASGERVATATRKQPEAYLAQDIQGFSNRSGHFACWEPLSGIRQAQEALFAGLRLHEGVAVGSLQKKLGMAAWERAVLMAEVKYFIKIGWLAEHQTTDTHVWRLTPEGWGRLDGILQRILTPLTLEHEPTPSYIQNNQEVTKKPHSKIRIT